MFLAFILYVWDITSVVWNLPLSLLPTVLYYLQCGSNLLLYKSFPSALNFKHSLCYSLGITFLPSFLSIASSVVCKRQKQPLEVFCEKRCSLKFHKTRKKKPTCGRICPATLLKKRLWHRCFPVNFAKILRKRFLQDITRWLLLKMPFQASLHVIFPYMELALMTPVLHGLFCYSERAALLPGFLMFFYNIKVFLFLAILLFYLLRCLNF